MLDLTALKMAMKLDPAVLSCCPTMVEVLRQGLINEYSNMRVDGEWYLLFERGPKPLRVLMNQNAHPFSFCPFCGARLEGAGRPR